MTPALRRVAIVAMGRRIFITVAEVSGDQHAAQLVRQLLALDPDLVIEGHGGPAMREAGVRLVHESTRRAAMSWKAISRAGEIWRLLNWTKDYFDRQKPELLICVDSPAMNFHFAKAARQRGIPVLYYIAPQLWAWREGRMKKLRAWVDRVACILPFEEAYFRSHGLDAQFVGHPLFDELPQRQWPQERDHYPHRPPIVGLLPGSRRPEALENFPPLLDVARQMRAAMPEVTFVVPTTPATDPVVEQFLAHDSWAAPANSAAARAGQRPVVQYALNQFDRLVPQCDLCLTVSGTATLHVAGWGIPMIVVYRGNWLVWNLLARWMVKTRTYSLVNLLAPGRKHIVPEFIPWYGSNAPVAQRALDYLRHPEKLADQRRQLHELILALDRPGASMNVAKMALELIEQPADKVAATR